jgi:AmmeMemoRadiSam system protein A
MSSLASREKQLLLQVARRALLAAVEHRESPDNLPQISELGESAGAFVTLHKRGRLRGCIGQLGTAQSLVEVVAHCAKAAALEDPRFDRLRPDEAAETEIELSVLSPLEEIAPEKIEAGKHGLMVSRGLQHGVLLPQVATEYRWTARRFLEETCVKAGLERDAWQQPDAKIQCFTAEVFRESEFLRKEQPGPEGRAPSRYSTST